MVQPSSAALYGGLLRTSRCDAERIQGGDQPAMSPARAARPGDVFLGAARQHARGYKQDLHRCLKTTFHKSPSVTWLQVSTQPFRRRAIPVTDRSESPAVTPCGSPVSHGSGQRFPSCRGKAPAWKLDWQPRLWWENAADLSHSLAGAPRRLLRNLSAQPLLPSLASGLYTWNSQNDHNATAISRRKCFLEKNI
jgi:hypothetical protein